MINIFNINIMIILKSLLDLTQIVLAK